MRDATEKPVALSVREIREVLRAIAFLVAARFSAENGVGETFVNTFHKDHPHHGVTDAQNVVIEFLEGVS